MTDGMDMMDRIAALRSLPTDELAALYERLWGKPPRYRNREFLWKRVAWKEEEQRTGGLSNVAKARLEAIIAEIDIPLGEQRRTVTGRLKPSAPEPAPRKHSTGTTFSRTWKGQEIRTTAVDGGFEYEGKVYRSLSAVAQAVTGSRWNGRLFFGLTARKRA